MQESDNNMYYMYIALLFLHKNNRTRRKRKHNSNVKKLNFKNNFDYSGDKA